MDQSTNSMEMKEEYIEVQALYKMWGLSDELCEILKSYGMNEFKILEIMSVEDMLTLFNKFDRKFFEEIIKFFTGIKEWRNSMNKPFVSAGRMPANRRILDWLEELHANLYNSTEATPAA